MKHYDRYKDNPDKPLVAAIGFDVSTDRLPSQTVTLEEYIRQQGVPIAPQEERTYETHQITGIDYTSGQAHSTKSLHRAE